MKVNISWIILQAKVVLAYTWHAESCAMSYYS